MEWFQDCPKRTYLCLLRGLTLTGAVCWAVSAAILYAVTDPGPYGWLRLAGIPFSLCPELPGGFVFLSLSIGVTPFLLLILCLLKREVCALAVWAHGTILVYWLWALFLYAGKSMAG